MKQKLCVAAEFACEPGIELVFFSSHCFRPFRVFFAFKSSWSSPIIPIIQTASEFCTFYIWIICAIPHSEFFFVLFFRWKSFFLITNCFFLSQSSSDIIQLMSGLLNDTWRDITNAKFTCKYVECCLNPATIKDDWPKIMSGKISSIKRRDQNASSSSNSSLSSSGGGDATMSADLASFFECPVCFDYVLPPILQCQSGHLVCSSCRSKLTCCPTCRGSLGNIRNLAMEKVYKCSHIMVWTIRWKSLIRFLFCLHSRSIRLGCI